MTPTRMFCFALLVALGLAAPVLAQSGDDQLAAEVQRAKEGFRAIDSQEVARRRAALQAALADLDQMLARSRQGYREGWRSYLRWDELQQSLASDEGDIEPLQESYERFRRNNRGLEMPTFLRARDRLR